MTDAGITLVCGGGGAKAAAHIGALRALEEAGLHPTRFLGTSMGSVFAAVFASGVNSREALERVSTVAESGIVETDTLALVRGLWARSLLKPGPFRAALGRLVSARSFAELAHPLTVTAVDLDHGELVTFGDGGRPVPLLDALYASCALPVFLPPGVIEGRRYADGGLRSVVPLELAARHPARLIVAVDVGPGFDELALPVPPRTLPPVADAHNEALAILMAGQTEAHVALWHATPGRPRLLYVRPRTQRGSTFRVDQVRGYVEEGFAATRTALAGLNSLDG